MTMQNPLPSDLEPVHNVYWLHLPDHTDPMTQGYVGIASTKRWAARLRAHRHSRRIPTGFVVRWLANNVTRFEAAKLEWQHRKQSNIGWNIKAGGGKFVRALMEAEAATVQIGLASTEYDVVNKVARFTYVAGTEINAPAIKAYCSDLVDGPPCRIEVFVGDQQVEI